ncbi:glycosyltransferase family 2 protein [Cytobacillus sp. FJAT-54145]|uniref:Glycosyltransferase family 2 protein n=1 Tax=Cytobacillus spartinae TaxID=3299023 RepID=A0ABW6KGC8_9BACI
MVKISVIIPVYNVQQYIKECIQSVVDQTLKDIEILVIDDGSKDASIDIVKVFNDKRIKIFTKKNGGLSSARNVGINNSVGEYIAFLDSDDFLLSREALEEMYILANKNNSDIVVGNALRYYTESNNYPVFRDSDLFVESTLETEEFLINFYSKKSMYAGVGLNLYKSSLLRNNTYFKEGILHEDEQFTPRVFLKAKRITIYPKEFYCYRQREGSITKVKDKTKNSIDIINTCFELESIFSGVENKQLRKILLNNLASLFLSACYMARLKEIPKNSLRFLFTNISNMRDLSKSILFFINKDFYYYINDLTKRKTII